MKFHEYSDKQIHELFSVLDDDGNGELSLEEFVKASKEIERISYPIAPKI